MLDCLYFRLELIWYIIEVVHYEFKNACLMKEDFRYMLVDHVCDSENWAELFVKKFLDVCSLSPYISSLFFFSHVCTFILLFKYPCLLIIHVMDRCNIPWQLPRRLQPSQFGLLQLYAEFYLLRMWVTLWRLEI